MQACGVMEALPIAGDTVSGARAQLVLRRALCAALASAGLYTLAFPPHDWWIAGWIVPGLLLVPARRLRLHQALFSGVVFALIMSVGVAHWVAHATLAYFDSNMLFASAFAAGVYLIYGGIPYGLAVLAYAVSAPRVPAAARGALAAWIWTAGEVLRANLFTGLPWALLGHSQYRNLPLIQVADLGGVYAVSFVMTLVSVTVAELIADAPHSLSPRQLVRRVALPATVVSAVLLYGAVTLRLYQTTPAGRGYRVAIVQGNVPNAFRWKREFFEETVATYANLTAATRAAAPDLVVWPENAVSFYIDREPGLRRLLRAAAAVSPEGLLVGAPRRSDHGRVHNSAYLIDRSGHIEATYDKRRLVPFAEYNPFPQFAPREASQPTEYTAGTSSEPLRAASARLGTIICYEVLFPHLVRDLVRHGAGILVNLSNDSWLDRGDGVAPRQHFSMSIFRAIEARRYLVRASASGISGFVSPTGAITATVDSNTAGTSIATVYSRSGETPYVRWGDAWVVVGTLATALAVVSSAPGRQAT